MHTFDHPPDYDIMMEKSILNPVGSYTYLIPTATIMSAWVEHGEFVHLWFCTPEKKLWP